MAAILPVQGVVLPKTGILSWMYYRGDGHHHRGIDLPAPRGTPVRAAAAGVVEHASGVWKQGFTGYGRHVVIRHAGGVRTLYAHLDTVAVKPGQAVSAGAYLGGVGNTAFSKEGGYTDSSGGAHLHFEVSPTAYPQDSEAERMDPVAWLTGQHPGSSIVTAAVLAAGLGWYFLRSDAAHPRQRWRARSRRR